MGKRYEQTKNRPVYLVARLCFPNAQYRRTPIAARSALRVLRVRFAQFFMVRIVPRPSRRSSLVTSVRSMT